MPAPDLPPPIRHEWPERAVAVHLTCKAVSEEAMAGGVVVMVDCLRASTTISAALAAGARRIVPTLTIEEARAGAERARAAGERALLGGERGGKLIDGFDLGNSPTPYTRERVSGASVFFTTTNGTAALMHARWAGEILVGSLVNLSAVCAHVAKDPRPVHILCAGTRDEVSMDDCLAAGAMVERLVELGRGLSPEDPVRLCVAAWRGVKGDRVAGLRESRGGRNLAKIGLDRDIEACALIDAYGVVGRFDVGRGEIVAVDRQPR